MSTGIVVLLWALGLGTNPPDVYTMRNRHLEIPIRVNEAKRADLKELELHVSTDQGRTWTLAGRAKPDQKAFNFHAHNDGLYWFIVCAVDRAGNRDPADIATAPPALKVLIDTVTPVLKVVAAERAGDEVQVAWETLDPQADPASLQLEYRAADQGVSAPWQRVPVNPLLNGQTRFRPLTTAAITLRLQINDSTGTPATVLRDLPGAPAPAANPAPVMTAPVPQPPSAIQQANSVALPAPAPAAPLNQLPNSVGNPSAPAPAADVPAPAPAPPAPVSPPPAPAPAETPPSLTPLAAQRPGTDAPPHPPVSGGPVPELNGSAAPQSRNALPEVRHVRDRQVAIDFEVEQKGPSGVKKIEVYITWDDGQTWMKWYEPNDTNPPLQLPLPDREGLFGFRLVLISGADQSLGPPKPGDPPDVRLVVDRTKPKVELYPPTIAPGQPNALILHYRAADLYLEANSVTLEWSQQPNGPWQPISTAASRPSSLGAGLRECTWMLPPEPPERVYLRLTAQDQAGNLGEFITLQPVTVDLHKPTVRIKQVLTSRQRQP
jgi:hypothetical protein